MEKNRRELETHRKRHSDILEEAACSLQQESAGIESARRSLLARVKEPAPKGSEPSPLEAVANALKSARLRLVEAKAMALRLAVEMKQGKLEDPLATGGSDEPEDDDDDDDLLAVMRNAMKG